MDFSKVIFVSILVLVLLQVSLAKYLIPFRSTESPPLPSRRECGPDESQPWFLPDVDDCTAYFACNGHFYVHRECPDGLHFIIKDGTCDHPGKAVGCGRR